MSVEHVKGNLLDFPHGINVIAHCANCQCTLGNGTSSGIARQIGDRFPAAMQADKDAHDNDMAELGLFSVALVGKDQRVVNIYGQERYGSDRRHLDYEGFYSALEKVRDLLQKAHEDGRPYTLGLPFMIGCAKAGGSWPVVEAMIQTLFAGSPIKCYIVEFTGYPIHPGSGVSFTQPIT